MKPGKHRYFSYLLRLWFVRQNDCGIWRASLEDPHTGTRSGFTDLEALMHFLEEQTQEAEKKMSDRDSE